MGSRAVVTLSNFQLLWPPPLYLSRTVDDVRAWVVVEVVKAPIPAGVEISFAPWNLGSDQYRAFFYHTPVVQGGGGRRRLILKPGCATDGYVLVS